MGMKILKRLTSFSDEGTRVAPW